MNQLDTSQKQMMVLGGFVLIAVIGLILTFTNGDTPQPAGIALQESPSPSPSPSPKPAQQSTSSYRVTLKTNFGSITFKTYDSDAPKTVQNFLTLAQRGFYNNLTFHRIVKGFVMQGGDPKGDGTGGPGYTFEDELNPDTASAKEGYKKGIVAMANAGPNTNGSQFFILLEDYPLPHNYTIFGKVIAGQDVVDRIGATEVDARDKPLKPVVIKGVVVEQTPTI